MSNAETGAATAAQTLQNLCNEKRIRCLYTSTTFLIWLKFLRFVRTILIILPIAFGALAGWGLLKSNSELQVIAAVFALLAGVIPAIYGALKFDEFLPLAVRLTGEYKNLEIAFGDLEKMSVYKPATEHVDALFVAADAFFVSRRGQFATLTARDRIPATYPSHDFVAGGGLMSYGADILEMFHGVGVYTGKVLHGAKPADMPVQQTTKFEFTINLQTAFAAAVVTLPGVAITATWRRSLARPGRNITGFANFENSIGSKWLELLKEIAPHAKRAGFIFNPDAAPNVGFFHAAESAAEPLAIG